MGYFNYHGKVKQKLKDDKLERFEIVERWNEISPALVLYFSDGQAYPIREHHWEEYFEIISKL